jgi:hypothetical protein
MSEAVAIGIVGGTAETPHMRLLDCPVPVTPELLRLTEPVRPTEVFRFAAPCLGNGCGHFASSSCQLVAKVVKMLPAVQDELPKCNIRPQCRWFEQEGAAACLRCPQIVTDDANRSPQIQHVADPLTSASE